MVKYKLGVEAFFHAKEALNWAISKQCETQCAFYIGLILAELLTRVGPMYMLTNWGILQNCLSSVSKGQICAGHSRPLVVSGLYNNIIRESNLGSLIPQHKANESVHESVHFVCFECHSPHQSSCWTIFRAFLKSLAAWH